MSSIPQVLADVKLIELITRANTLILALASDEDEESPLGRAVVDWLNDAETAVGPNGDCGCVLPSQSCHVCIATAREVNGDGDDELPF